MFTSIYRNLFSATALFIFVLAGGQFALPTQAMAQEPVMIALVSADGTVSIQGLLLGIEDGFYIIQTAALNEMRVQIDMIQCVSLICPA